MAQASPTNAVDMELKVGLTWVITPVPKDSSIEETP